MATSAAVLKLLECPVCLEILRQPKTLICNHSFCKSCLADILKSKYIKKDQILHAPEVLSIICPTCKQTSQEFRSLDDLNTLHVINELLEAHSTDKDVEKDALYPCSCGRNATVICYRCNSKYCSHCYHYEMNEHCQSKDEGLSNFLQSTTKHFFVKIESEGDAYICKDHSLPLDLFCFQCYDAICINCYFSKHRDHKARPIKYGRDDAVHLIAIIQSTENLNLSSYAELQQEAMHMLACAKADDQIVSEQMKAQERKVVALISSLFRKARLVFSNNIAVRSRIAEETMNFCQKPLNKDEGYDFDKLNDFELACLMNDLISGMDRRQCEAASIQERARLLKQHKFQRAFELCINENNIFNAILGIFDHFALEPQLSFTSIRHGFSFEDYSDQGYPDNDQYKTASNADTRLSVRIRPKMVASGVSAAEGFPNDSHLSRIKEKDISTVEYIPSVQARGRLSYSREFLLSLQHCKVRPAFPEGFQDILNSPSSHELQHRELIKDHVEVHLPIRGWKRVDTVGHRVLRRFTKFVSDVQDDYQGRTKAEFYVDM